MMLFAGCALRREARTQGAFILTEYERDRGQRLTPYSAARRHRLRCEARSDRRGQRSPILRARQMSEPSARLRVRVSPGASRTEIVGRYGDGWKVRVTAPAVEGRANQAVLALLADSLLIPRRDVQLVSGAGGRDKVIELHGVEFLEEERRLAANSGRGKQ